MIAEKVNDLVRLFNLHANQMSLGKPKSNLSFRWWLCLSSFFVYVLLRRFEFTVSFPAICHPSGRTARPMAMHGCCEHQLNQHALSVHPSFFLVFFFQFLMPCFPISQGSHTDDLMYDGKRYAAVPRRQSNPFPRTRPSDLCSPVVAWNSRSWCSIEPAT